MSDADTTKKLAEWPTAAEAGWSRLDAMSKAERHAAFLGRVAHPPTEGDLSRMPARAYLTDIAREPDTVRRAHEPMRVVRPSSRPEAEHGGTPTPD